MIKLKKTFYKLFKIVLICTILFIVTGCNSNSKKAQPIENPKDYDIITQIRGLNLASSYGDNMLISDYDYWFFLGYKNEEKDMLSFDYCVKDKPLLNYKVNKDTGEHIFDIFRNAKKEQYYLNDDISKAEYKPNSIRVYYSFYDKDGYCISDPNDPRYESNKAECLYSLSESDYNTLLSELKSMAKFPVYNDTVE